MLENSIAQKLKKVINPNRFRFVVVLYDTTLDINRVKEFLETNYPNTKQTTLDISKEYKEFAKDIYQDNNIIYIDDFKRVLETKELYYPFNQRRDKIASYGVNLVAFYPKALEDKLYSDAVTYIPDLWEFRTTVVKIEDSSKKSDLELLQDANELPLQYKYGAMKQSDKIAETARVKNRLNESGLREEERALLLSNLARLYESQGRYKEAEEFYLKALKVVEKVLGVKHPDTATTYNNLAGLYYSQGRYEEAEDFFLKALKVQEEMLGVKHPDTATTYNNLAWLYYSQGRYEEAEDFFLKALKVQEEMLGVKHPDTATTYNNLAIFYYNTKKLDLAYEYMAKAVDIWQKVLPSEHPDLKNSKEALEVIKRAKK